MILITGAAGKTGKAVIQALSKRNVSVRALVHRPDQVDAMRRLGVQEIIVGDMRSPASMQRACRGVHSIYHICPNVSPDEQAIGQTVLTAAQDSGVRHMV